MEEELSILQHLYGEGGEPNGLAARIEADDGLRREVQALSEVKFYLDTRPPNRPDARVLDAIMAASEQSAIGGRMRGDRPAAPPTRRRRMRFVGIVGMSSALLVAAVIGLGYLRNQSLPASAPTVASNKAAVTDATPPEVSSLAFDAAPRKADEEPEHTTTQTAPTIAQVAEAPDQAPRRVDGRRPTPVALQWDESAEVRQLHRRIGLVEARSTSTNWGDPVLPPSNGGATNGFQQATDWNY